MVIRLYKNVLMVFIMLMLIFISSIEADAAGPPILKSRGDTTSDALKYMAIDSPHVAFDQQIIIKNPSGITLTKIVYLNNTTIEIKSITASGNLLNITPKDYLEFEKEYEIYIPAGAVASSTSPTNINMLPITLQIKTGYYNFNDIMTNRSFSSTISDLINGASNDYFTLKELKVYAPKKYINDISFQINDTGYSKYYYHNSNRCLATFEISTDSEVETLEININGYPTREAKLDKIAAKIKNFEISHEGLTTPFDVEIIAYDANDNPLDRQTIKVAYQDKAIYNGKFTFKKTTAGKLFTFFDLLANPANLQKLLDENSMNDLKLQVAEKQ